VHCKSKKRQIRETKLRATKRTLVIHRIANKEETTDDYENWASARVFSAEIAALDSLERWDRCATLRKLGVELDQRSKSAIAFARLEELAGDIS
jgi:ribosomal protein L14E/L6E/L27E